MNGTASTNPMVDVEDNPVSIVQPQSAPFSSQEWEYITHQREKLGSLFQTRFDTKTKSFRIQNDKATANDLTLPGASTLPSGGKIQVNMPFFSKANWVPGGINTTYYHKILTSQPYTDEKGYEVVTPYPWGRWIDVNTAIQQSRLGILAQSCQRPGGGTGSR